MENTDLINAESMSAKALSGDKKLCSEVFGTWFSGKASPEVLIAKCTSQIEKYKRWIVNLALLQREQLKFQALAEKDKLSAYLKTFTREEIEDLLNEGDIPYIDAEEVE